MIENTCRYCSLTKPCDYAGYCSKECSMSDLVETLADGVLHSVDTEWRHHGLDGEHGRTRLMPADNYEGDTAWDE